MRRIWYFVILLPSLATAGTRTQYFSPLSTITFSSGTATSAGIVFDASASSLPAVGTSPLVFPITIGSGSNMFVAVGCGSTAGDNVTAITVGGNAMTLSTSVPNTGTTGNSIWTYAGPASGSQNISATIDSGVTNRTGCIAASWSGVKQSGTIDVSTATLNYPAAGSMSTSTITTAGLNEALFDVVMDINNDVPAPTQSGQTAIVVAPKGSSWVICASSRTAATAATYDMGWFVTQTPHSTSAIAIKPAP